MYRSIDRSTTVAPTAFSGTGSLLPPHGLAPTQSGRPVRAKRRARRAAALLALPERCTAGQDARQPRHVQSSRMLLHGGRIRTASSPVDSGRPRHRQARSVGRRPVFERTRPPRESQGRDDSCGRLRALSEGWPRRHEPHSATDRAESPTRAARHSDDLEQPLGHVLAGPSLQGRRRLRDHSWYSLGLGLKYM